MIRLKTLLGAAIFSAMAFTGANACSISAWSATDSVGVVAADSGEAPAFSRYSGRCSLRVAGGATAKYVQDNTPANATAYKSRFYINAGSPLVDTGAAGFVFLARDGAGANLIRIALTGGNLQTTVTGSAAAIPNIPITPGYYSVELEWAQGATAPFSIKVQGAGAAAPTVQTTTTNNAAGVLKDVRLGLSAASTGTAFFDEYDSRRTTAPGRLCRGDANGNGAIQGNDRTAISNEIAGTLAAGQPDATENGLVQGNDRTAVSNLILANTLCPTL